MNKLFISLVSLCLFHGVLFSPERASSTEQPTQLIAQTVQDQRLDLAESLIEQIIAEYPRNSDVLGELAIVLAENGQLERAWTLFETAWDYTAYSSNSPQQDLQFNVLLMMNQAGFSDRVIARIHTLENITCQAALLAEVAGKYIERDRQAEAQSIIQQSLQTLEQSSRPACEIYKNHSYEVILADPDMAIRVQNSKNLVQLGKLEQAVEIAKIIRSGYSDGSVLQNYQEAAFAKIIDHVSGQDDLDLIFNTIDSIKEQERIRILGLLGQKYLDYGNQAKVLEVAQIILDVPNRHNRFDIDLSSLGETYFFERENLKIFTELCVLLIEQGYLQVAQDAKEFAIQKFRSEPWSPPGSKPLEAELYWLKKTQARFEVALAHHLHDAGQTQAASEYLAEQFSKAMLLLELEQRSSQPQATMTRRSVEEDVDYLHEIASNILVAAAQLQHLEDAKTTLSKLSYGYFATVWNDEILDHQYNGNSDYITLPYTPPNIDWNSRFSPVIANLVPILIEAGDWSEAMELLEEIDNFSVKINMIALALFRTTDLEKIEQLWTIMCQAEPSSSQDEFPSQSRVDCPGIVPAPLFEGHQVNVAIAARLIRLGATEAGLSKLTYPIAVWDVDLIIDALLERGDYINAIQVLEKVDRTYAFMYQSILRRLKYQVIAHLWENQSEQ
ncbi:MAG: tetratricopeptide repeat protein [Cyanobacteria bacterium P01_G01_bin.54]